MSYKILNKNYDTIYEIIHIFGVENIVNSEYLAKYNNVTLAQMLDMQISGKDIEYPPIHIEGRQFKSYTSLCTHFGKSLTELAKLLNADKKNTRYNLIVKHIFGASHKPKLVYDNVRFSNLKSIANYFNINYELFLFVFDGCYFDLDFTIDYCRKVGFEHMETFKNELIYPKGSVTSIHTTFQNLALNFNLNRTELLNFVCYLDDFTIESKINIWLYLNQNKLGYIYKNKYYISLDNILDGWKIKRSRYNTFISSLSKDSGHLQNISVSYDNVLKFLENKDNFKSLCNDYFVSNKIFKTKESMLNYFKVDSEAFEEKLKEFGKYADATSILYNNLMDSSLDDLAISYKGNKYATAKILSDDVQVDTDLLVYLRKFDLTNTEDAYMNTIENIKNFKYVNEDGTLNHKELKEIRRLRNLKDREEYLAKENI